MYPVLVLSHEGIEPKLATRHFRVNLDASFCEPQSRIRTSSIVTLRNLILLIQLKLLVAIALSVESVMTNMPSLPAITLAWR